jgi:hypothetical protein
LEYTLVADQPPVPALTVTPQSGTVPLHVTADASGSTDTDATPIATYTFDFGDGTIVGPQPGATALHTYNTAGVWTVTVTVTDTATNHASTSKQVTATAAPTEYVTNPGFETDLTGWGHSGAVSTITRDGTTAHSGGFSARLSNPSSNKISCALVDNPNWVTTSSAGAYTASMWVRSTDAVGKVLTLTLDEMNGATAVGSKGTHVTLSAAWQEVTVTYTPTQAGTSTIGLTASVKTGQGVCFFADDASILH